MGRIGNNHAEYTMAFIDEIKTLANVEVAGIFTHFATADGKNLSFARKQLSEFTSLLHGLDSAGIHIPIKHCANSGAILQLNESYFDMVRPGIVVLGYSLPVKPGKHCR